MKKMTKDIKYVVERANNLLASDFMQEHDDERRAIMGFISCMLLEKDMYRGFNYYKKECIEGEEYLKLAGEITNLIQFKVN